MNGGSNGPSITRAQLVARFSHALGDEKAAEVIAHACQQLGIAGETLDQADALRLLDSLASAPGLVGAVARFAKVRVLLGSG